MSGLIGAVAKTAVIYLVLVVPVVFVAALLAGGFGMAVILGSLPFLLLFAIPSAAVAGLISLVRIVGVVGRATRGVMTSVAAGACGYFVTYAYTSQLDYGWTESASDQRASNAVLAALLFAVVGLITGLVVSPRERVTPEPGA
jgi:hypothetical protein